MDSLVSLKFLLLGESGVGKSSLMLRFTEDELNPKIVPTIGLDFKVKVMDCMGYSVKLSIWDTAGQERFNYITSTYYRGSHGVILVYDLTSRISFEKLNHWLLEESRYRRENNTVKLVVGNKRDLSESREVSYEEGREWAERRGFHFEETSAITSSSVGTVFDCLVGKILQQPDLWDKSVIKSGRRLEDAGRNINNSKGCCG